jgi:hypothetical protein
MMIAVILIYTVSLAFQMSSCVTIQNQCSNINLVSPVYFGNGVVCPKIFGQQIDISTKMNAIFEINATQDDFEGALLFKLQRYTDRQHNMNVLTTVTDKCETVYIYMLAAWKVKDSKPFVRVALVKHTKEFTWNEDKLKKLYYKNRQWLKEYDDTTSDTWSMDDNMIMKMSFKARNLKGNFELSISISEEERDDYAMRPLYIDPER